MKQVLIGDFSVIDSDGFRFNVGIIVCNNDGGLLWCRRLGKVNAWQFPQGGIKEHEQPIEAMYRELNEELGLHEKDVVCLAESSQWLSYILPKELRRYQSVPLCVGQKQKWFLLRLLNGEDAIKLDFSQEQEFDRWCWIDYWEPVKRVIKFKRAVYQQVLTEFETHVKHK